MGRGRLGINAEPVETLEVDVEQLDRLGVLEMRAVGQSQLIAQAIDRFPH